MVKMAAYLELSALLILVATATEGRVFKKQILYANSENIPARCIENSVTPVSCANEVRDSLMPHPDDCELFYYCSPEWKPVCRQCPAHLHFNPAERVCDHPDAAGCQSNATTISPIQPSTTTLVTAEPTTEPPSTEPPTTEPATWGTTGESLMTSNGGLMVFDNTYY